MFAAGPVWCQVSRYGAVAPWHMCEDAFVAFHAAIDGSNSLPFE